MRARSPQSDHKLCWTSGLFEERRTTAGGHDEVPGEKAKFVQLRLLFETPFRQGKEAEARGSRNDSLKLEADDNATLRKKTNAKYR